MGSEAALTPALTARPSAFNVLPIAGIFFWPNLSKLRRFHVSHQCIQFQNRVNFSNSFTRDSIAGRLTFVVKFNPNPSQQNDATTLP
ncbi:MAG: hypothetical protein JWQ04_2242 [Pedosphaera sp.]|nr:hypothetical protein [Pedosphaera sp.]